MPKSIRYLEAHRLHGHFDIRHTFNPGINVLYGDNGEGKTTLLNILANALNGDFYQFAYLEFQSIEIQFDDNSTLLLSRSKQIENTVTLSDVINIYLDDKLLLSFSVPEVMRLNDKQLKVRAFKELATVIYFPAHRAIIDMFDNNEKIDDSIDAQRKIIGRYFSPFTPVVYFPSLRQISSVLESEARSLTHNANIYNFITLVNSYFIDKKLALNNDPKQLPFELIYGDGYRSKYLNNFIIWRTSNTDNALCS